MSTVQPMGERLSHVEQELPQLRTAVFPAGKPRPWYEAMVGSMKEFPEFDEVVRLGREACSRDDESAA